MRWHVTANGKKIQQGVVKTPDLQAGSKSFAKINYKKINPLVGTHYYITVGFHLNKDVSWAKKGYRVAWQQFKMPIYKNTLPIPKKVNNNNPQLVKTGEELSIITTKNRVIFNTKSGLFNRHSTKKGTVITKKTFNALFLETINR